MEKRRMKAKKVYILNALKKRTPKKIRSGNGDGTNTC
jgi:hypothetical protein